MRNLLIRPAFAGAFMLVLPAAASAEGRWFSGNWYLEVGATGFTAPKFDGDDSYKFALSPIISLGKAGNEARFSSRNDGISLGLIDTGNFRAGPVGRIVLSRDSGDSDDLEGLDPIEVGVEVGGFAEFYPTDWLRLRGELRRGFNAHDGVVGDINIDAFRDVTPEVRLSGGPRLSFASAEYFDAYYGVDAAEATASGLSPYSPGGGLKSYGVGGAVDWKTTEKLTTSLFAEYSRLTGPAADSSLVRERGSPNQYLLGVSATYRFDFQL
ncbi:MipA/OmpV family protein [Mesorhizobium sp. BAC0120]|uniref:MipA/OmpV family protein n=1 Tax=Mesorhizobium sp. BAC0120 TaxID=3090670 RepID=UPI00298D4090|nr:MipA/OmpV family protein [Mesorhizobium sp. BAC0120]MDW6024089.1 MipA/OmpV family protein [Mesorhizobium sp. BAC0120]